MIILTLNAGSNSLKFEVVRTQGSGWGQSLLSGAFDDLGRQAAAFSLTSQKRVVRREQTHAKTHDAAARWLLDWLDHGHAGPQGIASLRDIDRLAHRIVHGADRFSFAEWVSTKVLDEIRALEDLAPLHNGPSRRVIEVTREVMGADFPMLATFDTAFHRDMPALTRLYALPRALAQRHRIRRYGFHGISHQYLALRTAELLGRPLRELRLITLHLEGGSSVAAIREGRSIDTSMGFTPLEGLMMGTRSGDLDPAIALHLMRQEGWTAEETERFLNKDCGLHGVSGRSADTRELMAHLDEPDVDLALHMFCYRVKKYVGAYLAALDGADAIVLGGGIGENTPLVRSRVATGLGWAGAVLDEVRNRDLIDREGPITTRDSAMPIWVVPTQEGLMMAQHAARASA